MINGRKTIADSFDGCIPDDSSFPSMAELMKKVREHEADYQLLCDELKESRIDTDIYKRALELACKMIDSRQRGSHGEWIDFKAPGYWIEKAKQELEGK